MEEVQDYCPRGVLYLQIRRSDFFDVVTTNINRRHPGLKTAFSIMWGNACKLITDQIEYKGRGNLSFDVKQSMFLHIYHDKVDGRKEIWASTFMKYLATAIMEDHDNMEFNELCNLFNNSYAAIGAIFV